MIIGASTGYFTSLMLSRSKKGIMAHEIFLNIVFGIIGAFVGGLIFVIISGETILHLGSLYSALIGAFILIGLHLWVRE